MPTCYYHPNVETLVSCGRCGKPLCPDCVGHGATGVRCKECLRQPRHALGLASVRQIACGTTLALVVGLALGGVLGLARWTDVIAGLVTGFLVATAAYLGSRRHRDSSLQAIAALTAVVGVLAAAAISLLPGPGIALPRHLVQYSRAYLPLVAGAVIGAVVRFRVW